MPPLDLSGLQGIKGQAQSASEQASNLSMATPGLLDQLRSNLTSIFTKDNPVMEARGQALSDFLSTPSRARAEFLPTNMPQVEGSALNLSPTQQDAITTSRRSAALAPLAGLNQIITGIYGNIPQLVEKAGGIYDSQVRAAQAKAAMLQQQYENAFNEILEKEKVRQFNVQEERARRGSGTGALDLSSWLKTQLPQQQPTQQIQQDDWEVIPTPIKMQPKPTSQLGYFQKGLGEAAREKTNSFTSLLKSPYYFARGLFDTVLGK